MMIYTYIIKCDIYIYIYTHTYIFILYIYIIYILYIYKPTKFDIFNNRFQYKGDILEIFCVANISHRL